MHEPHSIPNGAKASAFSRFRGWCATAEGASLLLVLLAGSLVYFSVPNARGYIGGEAHLDGYYYYSYLRSMHMDGDLDLSNEYRDWGNKFAFGKTATGRARNVFGVGPAIAWSPFFALSLATAPIARAIGHPVSQDSFSRYHQVVTFYGSLFYGWLALLFCVRLLRRLGFGRVALLATLGAGLAGPLPYYCLSAASYSHATAAMFASLLMLLWASYRGAFTTRRWLAFGACFGALLLVRPACAPMALVPLWAAWTVLRGPLGKRDWAGLRRALIGPVAGAATALAVFSPQIAAWTYLYGGPFVVPQGDGFFWWGATEWLGTLFSPRNGLFTSAPLFLLACVGLWPLRRQAKAVAVIGALLVLLTALFNGAVHDWWGWGFSARRFTFLLPVFVVGLGGLLDLLFRKISEHPRRAAVAACAVVVTPFILFNLEWAHQFRSKNLKWYGIRSTQALYLTVLHGLSERVYSKIGNPLSLPLTLARWAATDTPPHKFDRLHGSYVLGEINPATNPSEDPFRNSLIPLGHPKFRPHLSASFGAPRKIAGLQAVPLFADAGRIYVPINRPGSVKLWLRVRAGATQTRVTVSFNGRQLGQPTLLTSNWSTIARTVNATAVRRGINTIDLAHRDAAPPADVDRSIGSTGRSSPTDLAAVSGGKRYGEFCEFIFDGHRRRCGAFGLNILALDGASGALVDARTFDVFRHPIQFRHAADWLKGFPVGTIVLAALRGKGHAHFANAGGNALLETFGATSNLGPYPEHGYAAIGVRGSKSGSAIEALTNRGHAAVHVGVKPRRWRPAAFYAQLKLR